VRLFRIVSRVFAAALALSSAALLAQESPAAPAPESRPIQSSILPSNRAHVELCRKKGHVPLKPEEPQPQSFKESQGKVTRPTPIYQVPLRFEKRFRGTTVVEIVIDEDGCVRQTRLVSQTPVRSLNAAVLAALEQWVFLPATRDGRPVRVFFDVTFNVDTLRAE
jgi:TonB family protein